MNESVILSEISYRYSTSSGKGGQHVNRVNTKAQACFEIATSKGLSENEKNRLFDKLGKKINDSGELCVTSQQTRSQLKNKQFATEKLLDALKRGLITQKKRKETKIPKEIKREIKRQKAIQSQKKAYRKKIDPPNFDD